LTDVAHEHQPSDTAPADLLCGACGYNLRSIPTSRCPECGRQFSSSHLLNDRIPWEQRRHIGRFHAYWKTVWRGTFDTTSLADIVRRPVSYPDAVRFRRVVVLSVGLLTGGAIMWLRLSIDGRSPLENVPRVQPLTLEQAAWVYLTNPVSVGVTLVAFILWLWFATAIPVAFFDSKNLDQRQRNRAIAIGHYACAPLALLAPIMFLLLIDMIRFALGSLVAGPVNMLAGALGVLLTTLLSLRLRRKPGKFLSRITWFLGTISSALFLVGTLSCWAPFYQFNFVTSMIWARNLMLLGAFGLLASLITRLWLNRQRSRPRPILLFFTVASTLLFMLGLFSPWTYHFASSPLSLFNLTPLAALLILTLWWFNTLRLLTLVTQAPPTQIARAAILLPTLWLALALAILALLQTTFALLQMLLAMH
jgi:hypothetical protein